MCSFTQLHKVNALWEGYLCVCVCVSPSIRNSRSQNYVTNFEEILISDAYIHNWHGKRDYCSYRSNRNPTLHEVQSVINEYVDEWCKKKSSELTS
jgi:hypothetical protein